MSHLNLVQKQEKELRADYLAWRVSKAKKSFEKDEVRKIYNARPRLRSTAHH